MPMGGLYGENVPKSSLSYQMGRERNISSRQAKILEQVVFLNGYSHWQ
jgi:hypothetical protein